MDFKKSLKNIFADSWSIIAVVIIIIGLRKYLQIFFAMDINSIMCNISCKKFGFKINIVDSPIKSSIRGVETEYLIIFLYSAITAFILLTGFAVLPGYIRILAHILLILFAVFYMKNHDYSETNVIIGATVMSVYAVVGITRALHQHSIMINLAEAIIGGTKKRTAGGFVLYAILSLFLIVLQITVFRFIDFSCNEFIPCVVYAYFMLAEIFSLVYSVRCILGQHYCMTSIPTFRKTSIHSIIPSFVLAHAAGFLKPINIVFEIAFQVLKLCGINVENNLMLSYLEENHAKLYYAMVCEMPYFEASIKSRKYLWTEEIKKKFSSIDLVEPFFPVVFASALGFFAIYPFELTFFRNIDIVHMIILHYFFVIEIFHTFAAVDVISEYYVNLPDGRCNLIAKNTKENNLINDDVIEDSLYDYLKVGVNGVKNGSIINLYVENNHKTIEKTSESTELDNQMKSEQSKEGS